jgi:hypothetical protein
LREMYARWRRKQGERRKEKGDIYCGKKCEKKIKKSGARKGYLLRSISQEDGMTCDWDLTCAWPGRRMEHRVGLCVGNDILSGQINPWLHSFLRSLVPSIRGMEDSLSSCTQGSN